MSRPEYRLERAVRSTRPDEWTAERRETYLIDETVDAPLSVDKLVWPASELGTTVVITYVVGRAEDIEAHGEWHGVGLAGHATFLGYDVADGSMLSGLMNCGYSAPKPTTAEWRSLNRHHLFDDVEEALEFRAYSEARVVEHAPFFVYGLYSIEQEAKP